MMTVGQKLSCPGCTGIVEVVATGKGQGKDAEVKHVCSKCGDDAMFCTATKARKQIATGYAEESPFKSLNSPLIDLGSLDWRDDLTWRSSRQMD